MKLFILIFNLLSISSVLSEVKHLNKRDLCAFELQSYGECYLYASPKDENELAVTCQTLNKEKCKDLFKKGVSIIDECKGENGPKNEIKVKLAYLQKKALCEKDEKGNSCPYKDFIFKGNSVNSSPTADIINGMFESLYTETCKSEICTSATVGALDYLIESIDYNYNGFNLTSIEEKELNKEEKELVESMKSYYNGCKETSEKLKNECPPKNATNPDQSNGIENLKYISIQYTFSATRI